MIIRACLSALIACMVTTTATANPGSDIVGTHAEATWRVQSFVFNHSSSMAYSCAALRDKIAAALRAVGAHDGSVVAVECRGGMLRTARARITLASPVEATPENVQMPARFAARAELIARLRGQPAQPATAFERFPATWRRVSLDRGARPRLDARDCELVRGMTKQVFPRLSVRVQGEPMCINSITGGMPREIVALVRD